jgi:NitT/TauT family transport system substrate-binding protein
MLICKKKFFLTSIILVLLLIFVGCSSDNNTETKKTEKTQKESNKNSTAKNNKVSIRLQWIPQAQFAGFYVAKEKGFYDENNLDVDILAGGTKDGFLEIQKDEVDFVIGHLSTGMQHASNGVPVKCVGQFFPEPTLVLLSKKSSNISKPEDMEGKKVGIWEAGLFRLPIKAILNKYNTKPVFVGQDFTMDQFLNDEIDVASAMMYNEYLMVLKSGIKEEDLNVFHLGDYGIKCPEDGIYTSEKNITSNPEMVKSVVKATLKGWNYALNNKEEALEIVEKAATEIGNEIDMAHQKDMLNIIADMMVNDKGEMTDLLNKEDYDGVKKALKDQNLLGTKDLSYEEFYVQQ